MAAHMSLADQIAELIKPAPPQEAPEDDFETAARVVDKFDDDEVDDEFVGKSELRIRNAPLLDHDERYAGRRISVKQFRGLESDEESENSEESDENDLETDENDEEIDENVENDKENDEIDEESDENDEENDGNDEQVDDKDEMEIAENFSRLDFTSEIEKGFATRSQLLLWDSLLTCRINLQKVLQLSNQLPQFDVWSQFMRDREMKKTQKESATDVENMLNKLITLQTSLLSKYPDTKKLVQENDEEMDDEAEVSGGRGAKRKLEFADCAEFLAKRHADFEGFRNSAIEKWNDRTRLTTGKMKAFNAFDHTALKQIGQIMSDKPRLLTRSRTKRSVYRILGKPESADPTTAPSTDPEIFDDDDFYGQLLRELIEKQGAHIDDPIARGHHWAKIQKLRGKMKHKVDTKASKGRRIRYKVHTKLVNFMAPYEYDVASSESRKDLFSSLFGQTRARKTDVSANFLFGPMNNK